MRLWTITPIWNVWTLSPSVSFEADFSLWLSRQVFVRVRNPKNWILRKRAGSKKVSLLSLKIEGFSAIFPPAWIWLVFHSIRETKKCGVWWLNGTARRRQSLDRRRRWSKSTLVRRRRRAVVASNAHCTETYQIVQNIYLHNVFIWVFAHIHIEIVSNVIYRALKLLILLLFIT